MGHKNKCHRCGSTIPRGHQVSRAIGYCHNCKALTNLAEGTKFNGRIELRLKPSFWKRMRVTHLAKVCGQIAYMPNP